MDHSLKDAPPEPVSKLRFAEVRERMLEVLRRHSFAFAVGAAVLLFGCMFLLAKRSAPPQEPSRISMLDLASDRPRLSVVTHPGGAAVLLESKPIGVTPLRDHVISEDRRVLFLRVEKEGYRPMDTVLVLMRQDPALIVSLVPDNQVTDAAAPLPTYAEAIPLGPSAARGEAGSRRRRVTRTDEPASGARASAGTGRLQMTSQPFGASAYVGGRLVGRTPVTALELPVGTHEVTFELEGYEPYKASVAITPTQTSAVAGQLVRRQGTLSVLVRPWGSIYVDGQLLQRETDVRFKTSLPAGRHRVTVTHPTLGTWEREVVLSGGGEEAIVVDFNRLAGG